MRHFYFRFNICFNIKYIFVILILLCAAAINFNFASESAEAQKLGFKAENTCTQKVEFKLENAGAQNAQFKIQNVGNTETPEASKLNISISSSGGQNCSPLLNTSYSSSVSFSKDNTITVTADTPMYGIYLIWDLPAVEWTLSYGNTSKSCGNNGFLHEYVAIPEGAASCTISFSKTAQLNSISCYGSGSLPNDVQVWQPPCEKADILAFSTHADDEILFLGGPLVTYGNRSDVDVQVVYMCEFWSTQKIREHEKLDGLWECGIRHYPVSGNFKDLYSMSLDAAMKQYNYDDLVKFVTEQIRFFKPQVCIAQDLNGEYGHGGHRILSKAFCDAVDKCGQSDFCTDSAKKYGVYSVPKAYLHLYEQGKINLNLRTPIEALDNRTGLEVLKSAYKKHVSQQQWWFYVSDEYEYSCASFGLYHTTVGADTENDMLEHIVTYKTQAELAAKAEQARIEASIAASVAESVSIDESIKESQSQAEELKRLEDSRRQAKNLRMTVAICAVIVIAAVITLVVTKVKVKKRRS